MYFYFILEILLFVTLRVSAFPDLSLNTKVKDDTNIGHRIRRDTEDLGLSLPDMDAKPLLLPDMDAKPLEDTPSLLSTDGGDPLSLPDMDAKPLEDTPSLLSTDGGDPLSLPDTDAKPLEDIPNLLSTDVGDVGDALKLSDDTSSLNLGDTNLNGDKVDGIDIGDSGMTLLSGDAIDDGGGAGLALLSGDAKDDGGGAGMALLNSDGKDDDGGAGMISGDAKDDAGLKLNLDDGIGNVLGDVGKSKNDDTSGDTDALGGGDSDGDSRRGVIGYYAAVRNYYKTPDKEDDSDKNYFYGGSYGEKRRRMQKARQTLSQRLEKGLSTYRHDLSEGKAEDKYGGNIDQCITNVLSLLVSLEVKRSKTTTITKNTTIRHDAPMMCNFEEGPTPCFLKSSTSDLQWRQMTALKLSTKTGGDDDDDDDDEHQSYIYVDSAEKQYGFATLETTFGPHFPKKPRCLSFYYKLKGEDPGSLTVLALDDDRNEHLLFEVKGEQEPKWKYTKVDVPALDGLKLIIEAETGSGRSSNIAIDDITLSSGTCDGVKQPYEVTVSICDSMPCLNGATCLDNDKTFTCICAQGWAGVTCATALFIRRCSFESDSCFFKNVAEGDKFDWVRNKGETESKKTGPNKAYRGDYYMYAEASKPQRRGHIARLQTDKINPATERCLSFWYSMRGKGMGTLRVLAKGDKKTAVVLWEKSGNQRESWHKTNLIDVPKLEGLVLIIEMIRGWNWTSDAAIDDIVLAPGKCFAPREQTCGDGNPCHNHGLCTDTFTCDCDKDWTGKTCQRKVQPCDSSPCKNGGVCYNVGNVYQCDCRRGFTGIDCEVREPGNRCIRSCYGMVNGNYQSCNNCYGYIACSNNSPIPMNCPANLIWDDDLKTCERTSRTCE